MGVDQQSTVQVVHDAYSTIAAQQVDKAYTTRVASAFGYSIDELDNIPQEANLGLSCGNPVAQSSITQGEVVLDLGSGGGIDVFLAARRVGLKGQVIGLDMSQNMIDLARSNAGKQGFFPPQVSFVHTNLCDTLPIASESVDIVISNCVINLLPKRSKASILEEVARVLKPGGRVAISDIVAYEPLPTDIQRDMGLYIGCIGGAIDVTTYTSLFTQANLQGVSFVNKHSDLNIYKKSQEGAQVGCCNTDACKIETKDDIDFNKWVASYQIFAMKPMKEMIEDASIPSPNNPLTRWWDAFPAAQSVVAVISQDEASSILCDKSLKAGVDYIFIDVRSLEEFQAHCIPNTSNHPAQSFHQSLSSFYNAFRTVQKVIFYCNNSKGRGPRCAGWYKDYIVAIASENNSSEAYILDGGLNAYQQR